MGLFGSMGVGVRGLSASQLALDVTGQNISNANTEGYSRKRVSVSSDSRRDSTLGQLGNGVEVTNVERYRNEFIDAQIQGQMGDKGYYTKIDEAYERIENILNEPSDTGLNSFLDNFWDSLADLSNNPSDLSSRESVRANTLAMTNRFHAVADEMDAYRSSIDSNLNAHVETVNELTARISQLNQEIATVELGGKFQANDSRDNRDLALKELAMQIPVEAIEDASGRVSVTSGGSILVGPTDRVELTLYRDELELPDGTVRSEMFIRYGNLATKFEPEGGEIGGVFQIRDEILKNYEDTLDQIASDLVTAVNEVHLTGYDLDEDTGIYFFDPTKTRAGDIELSGDIIRNVSNIAAARGGQASNPAINPVPATVTALGTIDLTDTALDPVNFDARYVNLMEGSVTVTLTPAGTQLTEGASNDYVIDYTNGQISFVNGTLVPPGSTVNVEFMYNDVGFGGIGDGENAVALAELKNSLTSDPDIQGENTQTLGEFYSSFIGQLGIDRNEAISNMQTREYILQQLEQRQAEVSGVSLDEEMANMIKFEHSYQASAKFISTIDQMLEVLMNL